MKLSVCLIVRNEETRLRAALESVRALISEIPGGGELVVTDTGSVDGTVALAESLGARVNHFEWCEDFAAARNACQAHARGEWIFWLDGDERLKSGCDADVRRAIDDPTTIAHQVIREDFFSHDRPDWFSEMYQLRLVRRDLPCRFVGRIHEHLTPSPIDLAKAMLRQVKVSSVRLQHWGYTTERMPEKLRRAARLCAMELAERPGQLYYLVERARALIAANDREAPDALNEAAREMLKHRSDATAPGPMAAALIEQLLALPGQTIVSVEELLTLANRWFPRNAPLVWSVARSHALRGEWPEAERALRFLLQILENRTHDFYMSFDPRITEDARFNLAVALVRQARLDEARDIFEQLLTSDRRAADARMNLNAIEQVQAKFGKG